MAEAEREVLERRRKHLIIRVDRADLSKNVLRGFTAFDTFLTQHPEFREQVTFIAHLQPSRQDVPEYAEYLERIEALVAVVNHRHGTTDWMPIDLKIYENFHEAVARYKHFDLLMVNSIFDGMNLVAKEAPAVNTRDGVLMLSENTGSHEELGDCALSVNPFDIQEQADAIYRALTMDPEERRLRAQRLKEIIFSRNPGDWVDDQLRGHRGAARAASPRGENRRRSPSPWRCGVARSSRSAGAAVAKVARDRRRRRWLALRLLPGPRCGRPSRRRWRRTCGLPAVEPPSPCAAGGAARSDGLPRPRPLGGAIAATDGRHRRRGRRAPGSRASAEARRARRRRQAAHRARRARRQPTTPPARPDPRAAPPATRRHPPPAPAPARPPPAPPRTRRRLGGVRAALTARPCANSAAIVPRRFGSPTRIRAGPDAGPRLTRPPATRWRRRRAGRSRPAARLKHENNWGLRKMAYEINRRNEADYRWFRFEAPTELLDALDHNLKIADGVLRFRIFKVDPDAPVMVPARRRRAAPRAARARAPRRRETPRAIASRAEAAVADDCRRVARADVSRRSLRECPPPGGESRADRRS